MQQAIKESRRRRKIQQDYNKKHHILPSPIIKEIREGFIIEEEPVLKTELVKDKIKELKNKLELAQRNLQFEKAVQIKKQIETL